MSMVHINKKQLQKSVLDALTKDWRKKLNSHGLHNVKIKQNVQSNKLELTGDEKDVEKAKKVLGIE